MAVPGADKCHSCAPVPAPGGDSGEGTAPPCGAAGGQRPGRGSSVINTARSLTTAEILSGAQGGV